MPLRYDITGKWVGYMENQDQILVRRVLQRNMKKVDRSEKKISLTFLLDYFVKSRVFIDPKNN